MHKKTTSILLLLCLIINAFAIARVKASFTARPYICMSIDDGLASIMSSGNVFDLLEDHNITATFWLITKYMGIGEITWDNASTLIDHHNEVESEGYEYTYWNTSMTETEMIDELNISSYLIYTNLHFTPKYFAYPAGVHNSTMLNATDDYYTGARSEQSVSGAGGSGTWQSQNWFFEYTNTTWRSANKYEMPSMRIKQAINSNSSTTVLTDLELMVDWLVANSTAQEKQLCFALDFHKITDSPSNLPYEDLTIACFHGFIDYALSKDCRFIDFSTVMSGVPFWLEQATEQILSLVMTMAVIVLVISLVGSIGTTTIRKGSRRTHKRRR